MSQILDRLSRDAHEWNGEAVAEFLRKIVKDINSQNDRVLGKLCHLPSVDGVYTVLPDHLFHANPEVFIQLRGTTEFDFPTETFHLKQGQILFMPVGLPHRERVVGPIEEFTNLVIMLLGKEIVCHVAFSDKNRQPYGATWSRWHSPFVSRLEGYVEDWTRMQNRELSHAGSDVVFIRIFWQMLKAILEDTPVAPYLYGTRVSHCCNLVESQLADPDLSVKQLARQLNCAADYLSHQFALETGERLTRYINRMRVETSRKLLASTQLTISEIAFSIGYRQSGYYIRNFKDFFGCTPGDYRRHVGR